MRMSRSSLRHGIEVRCAYSEQVTPTRRAESVCETDVSCSLSLPFICGQDYSRPEAKEDTTPRPKRCGFCLRAIYGSHSTTQFHCIFRAIFFVVCGLGPPVYASIEHSSCTVAAEYPSPPRAHPTRIITCTHLSSAGRVYWTVCAQARGNSFPSFRPVYFMQRKITKL